jgi:hypothetical protein
MNQTATTILLLLLIIIIKIITTVLSRPKVRIVESRRLGDWAGLGLLVKTRNTCSILVRNSLTRRPPGRPKRNGKLKFK